MVGRSSDGVCQDKEMNGERMGMSQYNGHDNLKKNNSKHNVFGEGFVSHEASNLRDVTYVSRVGVNAGNGDAVPLDVLSGWRLSWSGVAPRSSSTRNLSCRFHDGWALARCCRQ